MAAPTFRKQERIVSGRLIETLFGKGSSQSLAVYPLRAVYMQTEHQEGHAPVQILISVPKKRFKHAVDRNRVKRQLREAYRQHKQQLCDAISAEHTLLLAFVWQSDRLSPSAVVAERMEKLLCRITEKVKP